MTVKVADLHKFITCRLCLGYLRDAHTIMECLHTFCKVCIVSHFRDDGAEEHVCPVCHERLGANPFAVLLPDRTLQVWHVAVHVPRCGM